MVTSEPMGFAKKSRASVGISGTPYEIAGTGGSWFRYAGDYRWSWQRDFFDHANAGAVFAELLKNGQLSEPMHERLKRGSRMPGWVKRSDFDWYETLG